MNSKTVSLFICAIMITSIFGGIPQNLGDERSYSKEPMGNMDTYIQGEPSSDLGETENWVDSIPQNMGESIPTLGGSGGLANSPWPMFRQNLNHTSVSPYDTSANNGQLKWSFMTGGGVYSSPAIGSDGTIYVGSYDHKLYAINPDGTEKWNFMTGGIVRSSPAINYNGTIYIGSHDDKLYAINPDGSEKWSFTTGGQVRSSPTIGSDGTIYVGSWDHRVYAINPDGTEKWNFKTGYLIDSAPAIGSDGTVYIGSYDYKLYAIKPDGLEKWNFTTGGGVRSSPAIGTDGTIYVGSAGNKFYAINPDGTQKWSFETGSHVLSSPAIDADGTIYIGSHDNNLYAINPDGTEKWSFTTEGRVHSSPAIGFDGTIYVGSSDDKIYAINSDGTEKWNYNTFGNITGYGNVESSPAIGADGTIYVGSWEYQLYAFDGTPTNQPPIANVGPDQIVDEGDSVEFDGSASYDPDGTIETYEWDFNEDDGLWWENGATPDTTGPTPTHIYGDDGIFVATLRVTDNDNLSATDTCDITVLNFDPTVEIESATMQVEIGLRVAGRKFNDVGMTLSENENIVGYISIERIPGSPDDQMTWIPMTLDMTKTYSATVTYTPEDPPNIGANPVWIYIKFPNGSIQKIHHNFNVQQSKNRDSDHWNHIEPWEVDLNAHLVGWEFEVDYHVADPGSDDEILTFTYGSQDVEVTHFNNPPNPDPYPSPEINPRDIYGIETFVYEGPGTITLVVKDDDNIRLNIGQGSSSIDID
jgi:outer membrane protein assembly factor BamB